MFGALAGVVLFFLVFDPRLVDPGYWIWLMEGDPATQYLGWRSIFWFNTLLGLLPIIITLWQQRAAGGWIDGRPARIVIHNDNGR